MPATEELAAARRVLTRPGMTVERVRLLLLLAGSSPRYWGPMFEKSCARGFGVRRLEEQCAALEHALARDPSAPGNRPRGGSDGFQTDTSEFAQEGSAALEATFAQKVGAVWAPFLELEAEGIELGLTGRELARFIREERERRTGQQIPDVAAMLRGEGIGKAVPKTQSDDEAPREPARTWRDAEDGDE